MDAEAFAPGTDEAELSVVKFSSLIGIQGRRLKNAVGWATLTNDRIVFDETKWNAGVGSAIGGAIVMVIAQRLQDRHAEKHGPLLQLPVAEIRAAMHSTFRLNRDVLDLSLEDGTDCRIGSCYKKWDPLLRRLLTERHGMVITESGDRSWRATPKR